MALKSKTRPFRRVVSLATALVLAALLAVPSSGIAQAQEPFGGGEFVARPVFDRQIETLFYAVRDADTGDWVSAMYRVHGREKQRKHR